jgi:hypothetical protein
MLFDEVPAWGVWGGANVEPLAPCPFDGPVRARAAGRRILLAPTAHLRTTLLMAALNGAGVVRHAAS